MLGLQGMRGELVLADLRSLLKQKEWRKNVAHVAAVGASLTERP